MSASAIAQRTAISRRWPRLGRLAYLRDVTLHLTRLELASRHRGTILGLDLVDYAVAAHAWRNVLSLYQGNPTRYRELSRLSPRGDHRLELVCPFADTSDEFARDRDEISFSGPVSRRERCRSAPSLVGLVDYLLALPVIFVALVFTTGVRPEAALLPLLMLIQFVFTLGLGVLFAPLQVYARDTRQFVALAISVGFWITPIFYRRRRFPLSSSGFSRSIRWPT